MASDSVSEWGKKKILVSDVAERFVRDNHFSAEERAKVRQAEYTSKTVKEFWKKVEAIWR